MMTETSRDLGQSLSYADGAVSLAEIISALTFALDLTEGAVLGHALRSCLLGMRLAEAMGIPEDARVGLYHALQLKDVGCSSNAARMTQLAGGDDRAMKAAAKLYDWGALQVPKARTVKALWRNVLPKKSTTRRLIRLARMAMGQSRNNKMMVQLRCERGAEILRMLEMEEPAIQAVRALDEHWDGSGYPLGLRREEIPVTARICLVAQHLDVFAMEDGTEAAIALVRKRGGKWFDPEVVTVATRLHRNGRLWQDCRADDDVEQTRRAVLALDPGSRAELVPERVDRICEAFAAVVDAKSPFTYRHSTNVADVAVEIALEMQLPEERLQLVRRAALLHDVGKLSVPNTILDKPGRLTDAEREVMALHPGMTRSILARVSAFRELAVVAAEHHERLDGSGYPMGLRAEQMTLESRLIALADNYTAMAEERPYRVGMPREKIFAMLRAEVPGKLDARCFAALERAAERWSASLPASTRSLWTTDVCEPRWEWTATARQSARRAA